MLFQLFFVLLFVQYSFCDINDQRSCFQQVGKKASSPKPLPETFKVSIEFADQIKQFAADIVEKVDGTRKVSALSCDHGDSHLRWLFNRSSDAFTFVDSKDESATCCITNVWSVETSKRVSNETPLFVPIEYFKTKQPVRGLTDLFDLFTKSRNISEDEANHEHDHGIDVLHYIGCDRSADNTYWVEFDVCISKNDIEMSDKQIANVPTRIQLKIYNGTNSTDGEMVFNSVYEMSAYRSQLGVADEECFLPPRGVVCDGWNKSRTAPDLPKRFKVHIEYVDFSSNLIDSNWIFYDFDQKLVGFIYSHNNTDEPLTAGIELKNGRYKVVHDFKSGLQFVVDENTHRCVDVSPIPSNAGDVVPSGTEGRFLGLKTPMQVLLSPDASNLLYIGRRFVDDIPYEVWAANVSRNSTDSEGKLLVENLVYDVYFNTEKWTVDGTPISASLPRLLKVYHRDNYKRFSTSSQVFHDYVVFDDHATNDLLANVDVLPCFTFSLNDSFLVVEMNGTMEDLKRVGVSYVENRLKATLASAANVSVLRIADFYYQPTNDKRLFVFFVLSELSNVFPAKTEFLQPETNASGGRTKLNATLIFASLLVDVKSANGEVNTFEIRQGSLNVTSPFFRPKNSPKFIIVKNIGYSKGSMAALGIFMLLIGIVGGSATAVYFWKRNRGGGVAYQIYE